MIKNSWKLTFITISIAFLFILSACGSDEKDSASNDGADSNEETNYSEEVNYTITGIEPGAGISVTTDKAIEEYDSLKGWTANYSSTAAMASELDKAMENEEPIIITGWNPHWTFAKYPDMKYLEDPKGIYGGKEVIKTLTRNGLKEDMPNAYKLLDQFNWKVEDMEGIMYDAKENDEEVAVAAERWVEENQDRVDEWKNGVEEVDGKSIELVSTPWDSERASSNVVKIALEQLGYDVTVTPVDVAVVFESIANGDGDATLAAWMPITHKDFYDKYSDQFDDLGANLEGAKIGLVVPSYMDIESIEDLEPAN
ncbi:glycine betaine ABC transporter substrate-binding protein [Virgibacillus halodenitrificans]|uniref:glycine betaine ABC transporter substrate-binding protein n=1 Tax=Virgibacillus halodenitrificans TaxID=1482 RepID=UPI00045C6C44|nr:glycine betaine ABC transporter substrate-binding protein [Virgibacillus halodenitrificans]MCG1029479.1 glycine/betaine ABC transporter [Virgibacillus halodenitrificans]CDQ32254.1 Glycine betaine-binding protein OpuAC precursor [Virgibacillus halodenitrificans]